MTTRVVITKEILKDMVEVLAAELAECINVHKGWERSIPRVLCRAEPDWLVELAKHAGGMTLEVMDSEFDPDVLQELPHTTEDYEAFRDDHDDDGVIDNNHPDHPDYLQLGFYLKVTSCTNGVGLAINYLIKRFKLTYDAAQSLVNGDTFLAMAGGDLTVLGAKEGCDLCMELTEQGILNELVPVTD